MISLDVIFWMYVILFAFVGAMRGWAKELLVSFSVILSLFLIMILETYVTFIREGIATEGGANLLFMRLAIFFVLIFFGYQTPNIPRFSESPRFIRERLQDSLLGVFVGAVNGFLVFGTFWYFLDQAGYPLPFITPPQPGTPAGDASIQILATLAPQWLTGPILFFAVALAFVCIFIIFI